MGIPYADQVMNAVVLTAVLSCLNSGLYTASRMLFVLAARREAPMRLITVNGRGVPVWAILASTVVGFLSVIAAYVSPDTVFTFLLNSSGAVILFVYLLIAVSQFVLRRRTPEDQLTVKMWFFPVLTILAAARHRRRARRRWPSRTTPARSCCSACCPGPWCWCSTAITRWQGGSVSVEEIESGASAGRRRRRSSCSRTGRWPRTSSTTRSSASRAVRQSEYLVVVPVNPIDTGQADREGAAFVWQATTTPPGNGSTAPWRSSVAAG